MEKTQNEKRCIIIEELENFIGESSIWQTVEKISENTGLSIQDINQTIEDFNDFAQRKDGKITTKRNWEKWTPFWKRFFAIIVNHY